METLNSILLVTLLEMAQNDEPASVSRLARELDLTRAEVATRLNQLSKLGLVRAETIRLTFVGLMRATGLRARRSQPSGVAA
jgi:Mn-dependent DtxR family transcriptional regulator